MLNEVKETLNKLTGFEIYEGKQTKLIILVDEIDRCLPNEQLKVLERLHHLLDVHNCFVVCSLNKKSMTKSFVHNFDNDGAEYLKKFFDKELYLESLSENYLDKLLSIKLDEIAEIKSIPISREQKTQLTEFLNCILGIYCKKLKNNLTDNREITRIWDSIVLTTNMVYEITKFEQICTIIVLIYFKNFLKTDYEKNLINLDSKYVSPIDFVVTYISGQVSFFANSSVSFYTGKTYNQYNYSFLRYFNMSLNYYKFGVKVDEFYKTHVYFNLMNDKFIQNFTEILKKVETYGK